MPPGPGYNWFCVLYSTVEILSNAARYRAAQLTPKSSSYDHPRKRRRTEDLAQETEGKLAGQGIEVDQATVIDYAPRNLVEGKRVTAASKHAVWKARRELVELDEVGPVEVTTDPYASEPSEKAAETAIDAPVIEEISGKSLEKEHATEKLVRPITFVT